MPGSEGASSSFTRLGIAVDDAVQAWTGWYPWFGGNSSFGYLFTRQRLLAHAGDKVALWSAYSGPTPEKLILTAPIAQVRTTKERSAGYDEWLVAGEPVFVRVRDRDRVRSWLD
jgi:hypothetical protein